MFIELIFSEKRRDYRRGNFTILHTIFLNNACLKFPFFLTIPVWNFYFLIYDYDIALTKKSIHSHLFYRRKYRDKLGLSIIFEEI